MFNLSSRPEAAASHIAALDLGSNSFHMIVARWDNGQLTLLDLEDELLALLALWESKYADKPSFALNEFLGEVASATERKLERARLYRELVAPDCVCRASDPAEDFLPRRSYAIRRIG